MIQFLSTDYFVSPRDLGLERSSWLGGVVVAGLPMMPDAGEGWPLWPGLGPAGQRTGGPPGAVITRNKM